MPPIEIVVTVPEGTIENIRREGPKVDREDFFYEWLRSEIVKTLSYSFYPYGPFDVTVRRRER